MHKIPISNKCFVMTLINYSLSLFYFLFLLLFFVILFLFFFHALEILCICLCQKGLAIYKHTSYIESLFNNMCVCIYEMVCISAEEVSMLPKLFSNQTILNETRLKFYKICIPQNSNIVS